MFSEEEIQRTPLWAFILLAFIFIVIPIGSICFFIFSRKSARKKAQKNIIISERKLEEYDTKLANLKEKEKSAMNDFKALLFVPDKYW